MAFRPAVSAEPVAASYQVVWTEPPRKTPANHAVDGSLMGNGAMRAFKPDVDVPGTAAAALKLMGAEQMGLTVTPPGLSSGDLGLRLSRLSQVDTNRVDAVRPEAQKAKAEHDPPVMNLFLLDDLVTSQWHGFRRFDFTYNGGREAGMRHPGRPACKPMA